MILVDGNNFYHGLKSVGATSLGQLDFAKIALKLAGPRTWIELRYYVGQVTSSDPKLYADQRSFVARQTRLDGRISFHFGRLEARRERNDAAVELLQYMSNLKTPIDPAVYKDLIALGQRHKSVEFRVEKAVDVMLAVDLVVLAERGTYDTAYVISADGDYTHAVTHVRTLGKKVFAVSPTNAHQLSTVANSLIRVDAPWLRDCYI